MGGTVKNIDPDCLKKFVNYFFNNTISACNQILCKDNRMYGGIGVLDYVFLNMGSLTSQAAKCISDGVESLFFTLACKINQGNGSLLTCLSTPAQNNTKALNICVNVESFSEKYLNDFNNTFHAKSSNIISDCIKNGDSTRYILPIALVCFSVVGVIIYGKCVGLGPPLKENDDINQNKKQNENSNDGSYHKF